jgi:ketosteroid isomerase-like protein
MAWQLEGGEDAETSLGRVFHVVRVAGGRIVRLSVFLDEAAALRAAGLPE